MYTEERRLLTDFLDQLKQAEVSAKDSEADALINQAVAQKPDAAYLLVQKALLQEQALNAAKIQVARLQKEVDRLRSKEPQSGGFLGSALWGASAGRPAPAQSASGPAASSDAPNTAEQSAAMSFLGMAAVTAAGTFLLRGIESLLHRDSGGGFLDSASAAQESMENLTMNEYDNADEPALDIGLEQTDFDNDLDEFDGYDDDGSPDV